MDPYEVIRERERERERSAAPLMTQVSISLLQIIYIKDSKCLLQYV